MKSNKLIKKKHLEEFDYTNHDECLEAVNRDGFNLRYIRNQTEDICLEAAEHRPHLA